MFCVEEDIQPAAYDLYHGKVDRRRIMSGNIFRIWQMFTEQVQVLRILR
jgi:hypothetical protein